MIAQSGYRFAEKIMRHNGSGQDRFNLNQSCLAGGVERAGEGVSAGAA
jgi:hypothetical protein